MMQISGILMKPEIPLIGYIYTLSMVYPSETTSKPYNYVIIVPNISAGILL